LAAQIAVEDAQAKCDSFDEEEELNEFLQEWEQYGFLQQCSATDGERLRLDNLLILDIQAAATVICNKRLVTDIRASKKTLRLKSNGGTIQIKQQATMEGFRDPVWYSPKALGNVIALKDVESKYRVTYDSDKSTFVVHRKHTGKPNMNFVEHETGLHIWLVPTAAKVRREIPGVTAKVRREIPGVTADNVSIPGVDAQIPGVPGAPPQARTTRVRFQSKVEYEPTTIGGGEPKVAPQHGYLMDEWTMAFGPSKRRHKKRERITVGPPRRRPK
jgi:hypothetical protein